MYDAHAMQVVHCVQNLVSENTGILLRVTPLGYDTVKQLTPSHPVISGLTEKIVLVKGLICKSYTQITILIKG